MPDDVGFAPPAFDAAQALMGVQRQLRELRLSERGSAYEQAGKRIVELRVDVVNPGASVITARLVKRPAMTPEWTSTTLRSATDVRKFIDTVKQQLARWSDAD